MKTISGIYIYTVKSLDGISLQEAEVTDRGLKYDRRWMIVDINNKFLTQRTHPQMALITVDIMKDYLVFRNKKSSEQFEVMIKENDGNKLSVNVWDDTVSALHVNSMIDEWISQTLNLKCKLVYMPDDSNRFVDRKYASKNEITSFSDAYPFLIIGQSSLDDLNTRLAEKVPMNRFRPNFVFTGGKPFEEDEMKKFKIGNVVFYGVKPCSRCVVTTVNQETAEKKEEPLKTLSSYRTINNMVMFGMNLLHEGNGILHIGDELEAIERK
jgi:uncharacterized protein